ncbi:hypothetical protein [Puniceibacterium sediminis]|uniref:Uncharacterized protein n=1 Tax=Puniceibacterium sediminis TaxID=1608407 RepID=A0A238XQ59_9RHOB|nr:hypothetical protein [Puniceibacterium sediminis]SNR60718.1 hypothetical protein SAMN06265370_11280 [Puniceibacterium sediminis]
MTGVEVLGRDVASEAYRVRVDMAPGGVTAQVPEVLMEGLRPGDRPTHQEAYEWIARHGRQIQAAITALRAGRTPRLPMDLITLEAFTDAR